MRAEKTRQLRGAVQTAQALIDPDDRYIDYGVEIRVARQDIENGVETIHGKPPMSPAGDAVQLGGILDLRTRRIVGPSENPIVWYASEIQLKMVMHDYEQSRVLVHAAEGSGKSHTLCMHSVVQVLQNIGWHGHAGLVAPTGDRLKTILKTMLCVIPIDTPHERKPGSWATYFGFGNTGELRFKSGITIQFRSSHQASAALGSPIQGANWLWADADELQDIIEEKNRDADIEARLRVAPKGQSKRFSSASVKDNSTWRAFIDLKRANKHWAIERMPFDSNLVVWPSHWVTMRENMSEREWKRRGLALNMRPELAVYHNFSREMHVRPVPQLGAQDITERVLAARFPGMGYKRLVGHDPGNIVDVSEVLRCYNVPGIAHPVWYVVDEIVTEQTTSEEHCAKLMQVLQQEHGCTMVQGQDRQHLNALVLCDPANEFESRDQPHRNVYRVFHRLGMVIKSADPVKHRVPKAAGAEMVVGLLKNVNGVTRLYLAADGNGVCKAPRLLQALEEQEKDSDGKIETSKKDKNDTSHYSASLRYALWRIEKYAPEEIGRITAHDRAFDFVRQGR